MKFRVALTLVLAISTPVIAAPISGHWAGDGLTLDAASNGARLALDCAIGSIDAQISPDAHGRFSATGSFNAWQPGPQRADEPAADTAARFSGRIRGDRMTLTIVRQGIEPQTFTMVSGAKVKLVRCL